jgi:plasmid stability protein
VDLPADRTAISRYHIFGSLEPDVVQLIVRGLEADLKARLKRRAAAHGHSMEEEIRLTLRAAVKDQNQPVPDLGSRIAARFAKIGLAENLPELRGQQLQLRKFSK